MEKFSESSGLGISLEANNGHHYIRSVLPEGPVGCCGKLFSGDELLEVHQIQKQLWLSLCCTYVSTQQSEVYNSGLDNEDTGQRDCRSFPK